MYFVSLVTQDYYYFLHAMLCCVYNNVQWEVKPRYILALCYHLG